MRFCDFQEFDLRFGKSDIEAPLSLTSTLHEELHRDRCLSRSRIAFDEIKMIARQAPSENVVKAGDAGGEQFYGLRVTGVGACAISRFGGCGVLREVRIHDVPQSQVLKIGPG